MLLPTRPSDSTPHHRLVSHIKRSLGRLTEPTCRFDEKTRRKLFRVGMTGVDFVFVLNGFETPLTRSNVVEIVRGLSETLRVSVSAFVYVSNDQALVDYGRTNSDGNRNWEPLDIDDTTDSKFHVLS